jgi:hypothetical protein
VPPKLGTQFPFPAIIFQEWPFNSPIGSSNPNLDGTSAILEHQIPNRGGGFPIWNLKIQIRKAQKTPKNDFAAQTPKDFLVDPYWEL